MPDFPASWLRSHLALLALLAVTFCIYIPSLSGEFVIDDVIFIQDNPYIKDIRQVSRYFTKGLWENSALEVNTEAMYRPMNLAPFLLGHALWGAHPVGYHALLLLLHLANICLVYVLVHTLTKSSIAAATFGAAVFALHPTRVESVAWISGGIDPLVTLFLLIAFVAHLFFVAGDKSEKQWRYLVLTLFSFQLALWSKEAAIIFPLIIVAHDWLLNRKITWVIVLPQTLMVAVYLIMRSAVLGETGKWSDLDFTHLSKVVDFGLGYSEMLLMPAHIPLYIQPPEHAVSSFWGIISVLMTAVLLVYCWKVVDAHRKKVVIFSTIWAAGFFWPAILLAFYTNGFYAGRFLYVPAFGMVIIISLLYEHITTAYSRWKFALMSAGISLIGFYGLVTWKDIPAWHDKGTIYRKIAQDSPENSVGFVGMGDYFMSKENYAEAENNFLLVVQKAKTPRAKVSALVNLGTINGINNRLAESEVYLKEAVKIDPKSSEGWTGLGNLAQIRGDYIGAVSHYEAAMISNPKNYEAAMNLAVMYDKTGQFQRGSLLRQQASAMPH